MAKRNTKQLIIEAATSLFARKGYNSTTVEDIASVIGIRPSALYKHYKGKRQIFVTVLTHLADAAVEVAKEKSNTMDQYFAIQPSVLFIALHAGMLRGEDFDLVNEHCIKPLSPYWKPEDLFAEAGILVWRLSGFSAPEPSKPPRGEGKR